MKTKDSKPQCIAAPHPIFSSELYKLEAEMMDYFREHPSAMYVYQRMHKIWQQRLMGIFNGTRTMPLTYDAFFKKIFHPDVHPERLSRLLSSLLGQEVEEEQLKEQYQQLEKQEKQLKEQYQQMEKQQEEIKEQKKRNFQLTETLKKKDQTIEEREQEIAKLKSLLASKS